MGNRNRHPWKTAAFIAAAAIGLGTVGVGCARSRTESSASAGALELPPAAAQRAAAKIGAEIITLEDVDRIVAPQLFELRAVALRQALVTKVVKQEAKQRRLNVRELRKVEVEDKTPLPPAEEARATLEEWLSHGDLTLEEAAQMSERQVAARLRQMRLREREDAFFDELFRRHSVIIDFDALGKPELDITPQGPSLGAADAPVTLVEFSDLTVSFMALWQPTLERLVTEYGGSVRFLFKQKLENPKPDSPSAVVAQAALCADDQGRYWEFRKALLGVGTPTGRADAFTAARAARLDQTRFESCIDSGQKQAAVRRDMADVERNGLMGDPVVVVNGIRLSGAQPFPTVERILKIESGAF